MIWSLLSWLSQHPAHVVAVVVALCSTAYVIGAAVYAVALASESRRQDAERARLDRVMQASHRPPTAPGYPHRRIS